MQGIWVPSLVLEEPTCCGATKPLRHSYWAHTPRACALQREAPAVRSPSTEMKSGPSSLQLEKAHMQEWRPCTAINRIKKKKKTNRCPRLHGVFMRLRGKDIHLFHSFSKYNFTSNRGTALVLGHWALWASKISIKGIMMFYMGFPGGSASKESACNAGDLGSIPGLGRSAGEGNGDPL